MVANGEGILRKWCPFESECGFDVLYGLWTFSLVYCSSGLMDGGCVLLAKAVQTVSAAGGF
jgi:hypothetical protein